MVYLVLTLNREFHSLTSLNSRHVEKYLATEAPHKHLVFVLNKIDLVPSSTAVSFDIPVLRNAVIDIPRVTYLV